MSCTIVVGLGRSGVGAARLLKAQGAEVIVLEHADDAAAQRKAKALNEQGIEVKLGQALELAQFEPWLAAIEQVVISPGISWTHPTLEALRALGVTIRGEMAIAWQALGHCPWIGITGTNGKTTVTHLLHHVLTQAGLESPIAGNVGFSAAELALACQDGSTPSPEWVVMEMSSYQIEAAPEVAPRIGIWTTLTPDHLERHGTLEVYRSIKRGLLERSELALLNGDDPDISSNRNQWQHPQVRWISTQAESKNSDLRISSDDWVCRGKERLFSADALPMPGAHNRQNMLLVTAAALEAGLSPDCIEAALRSFPGVPHRLEPLGCVHDVAVFNDSKATNYDAAAVGLRSVTAPVVLLAGGQTKQGDARDWLQLINQRCSAVVLFGAGAEELRALIGSSSFSGAVAMFEGLEASLDHGLTLAKEQKAASLLLSPACASFDQYVDFEARGDHFRSLIASRQAA